MKKINWKILLSVALIGISLSIYLINYSIFHKGEDNVYYFLIDLAFLPLSILLVTLIVDQLITRQERRNMFNKLNMVIGAFFSEAGIELLRIFWRFDTSPEYLGEHLVIPKEWKQNDYYYLKKIFNSHKPKIEILKGDAEHLKKFLGEKREFLLRLLENPNLLEHETFTALLWAVFHLTEELSARPELRHLPAPDYEHLEGDIKRAYTLLIVEWIIYMRHLYSNYPYLFSLAIRTNPFDLKASAIIRTK
ncbi:MAG: hypothetical protein Q8O12_05000 [Candidatus Omnitrophota bacterium]|nr:hypothetical protein [Candidatus Omnitrophota bacterium]